MRSGITPVVAIVLLLMMTVAASGGAYAWITTTTGQAQQEARQTLATDIDVKAVRCDDTNVSISLSNTGDTALTAGTATAYLYRGDSLATTTPVDMAGRNVLQPGGVSTIQLPFLLDPGRRYTVELELPWEDVSVERTCQGRTTATLAYWDFESKTPGAPQDAARSHHGTFENNERDGTFTGDPEWVSGSVGSHALAFDGDDTVEVSDSPAIDVTSPFSMVVWTSMRDLDYASGSNRLHFFMTKGGPGGADPGWATGYDNRDAGDDGMRWRVQTQEDTWGTGPSLSRQFANDTVLQVAMTVTASTVTGYLDGGSIGTTDVSAKTLDLSSTDPLRLGGDSNNRHLDGTVQEARLYDRALTGTEISALDNGTEVRSGLIGEWTLDEGSGSTAHDTSRWVTGKVGDYALRFDGNTSTPDAEYVGVSGAVDDLAFQGDDTFSLAAWLLVNESMVTGSEDIRGAVVARGAYTNSFGIWVSGFTGDGTGVLRTQARDGTNVNGLTHSISAGEWVHAVMTFDAGEQKLYADGELIDQRTDSVGTLSNSEVTARRFRIGGLHMTGGNGVFEFNGRIDDVRVYDTELTADQVSALYNATR